MDGFALVIVAIVAVAAGAALAAMRYERELRRMARFLEQREPLGNARMTAEVRTRGVLTLARGVNAELDALQDERIAAQTARQSFQAGLTCLSHDIRTPLSMILGYADALAQDPAAPDEARENARIIRTQGLKIKDLITDLNTASQLDYDMQPLHLERVLLPRLLRTVMAAHANSGLDELHPMELDIAEDALDTMVLGDGRLLTRAVENAIANARLHNEQGCTIRVTLRAEQRPEGRYGTVCVSDDGEGISPADLAALEARLARARTAKSAAGSFDKEHGLGLVLIDRIARAHGGFTSLYGSPSSGFTIEIALPLA